MFVKGAATDLRDMLLRAGVGQATANMSIPFMHMLPLTVEPYAQGVIQLVQGLQRLLNAHGAGLAVDGGLGRDTVAALQVFSGPLWTERSWSQLYGDVIAGERWHGFSRCNRATADLQPEGLGASFAGDVVSSPLLLIGAAALGVYLWKRKR